MQALSIGTKGFFYIIQANHDIYDALGTYDTPTPDITKIKKSIFWDSDISSIDWNANRKAIIRRIFEYGDESAITEIIRFYGNEIVTATLASISDPRLQERRAHNMEKYL